MDKCSVRVGSRDSSPHSGLRCFNPAKVVRDGKPYCGVHDPVAAEVKRESRKKGADVKWASEMERGRRRAVILNLTFGISTKVFDQKANEIREFLEALERQIK